MAIFQALKNGKAVHEIECSRTIVQKTVDLKVSDNFVTNRHRYGTELFFSVLQKSCNYREDGRRAVIF